MPARPLLTPILRITEDVGLGGQRAVARLGAAVQGSVSPAVKVAATAGETEEHKRGAAGCGLRAAGCGLRAAGCR